MKKLNNIDDFILLWLSEAISSLGSSMTKFALIIWAYNQKGSASSIAYLSVFTYLPSVLFCFIAGTLADKWDKKKIMLFSNFICAAGIGVVFFLYNTGNLFIWHLYLINFVLSFVDAFKNPATIVAVSLLAKKDQYLKVSGLQSFSNSLINILSPSLAPVIMGLIGLKYIFILDIISFGIAFFTLLIFIPIPYIKSIERKESFLKSCFEGLNFLKENKAILSLILFFAFINFLAYLTGFGIMPAMILKRSGDNQKVLGLVSSFVGIGTLLGSFLVAFLKSAKSKTKVIFLSLAVSFVLANIVWAIGRNVWIWVIAAFLGNIPIPFISANMTTIMRIKIPVHMQGRVFSTRDTLQFFTVPIGLFLSGLLADHVFEPFMMASSPFQQFFSILVGYGPGAGIALMFLITGIVGTISSLIAMGRSLYRELDL